MLCVHRDSRGHSAGAPCNPSFLGRAERGLDQDLMVLPEEAETCWGLAVRELPMGSEQETLRRPLPGTLPCTQGPWGCRPEGM